MIEREEVSWVNYPGLNSSKYHNLADKYLPNGKSGIDTFGLKKGFEAAKKVAESTKIFALLANIGDTKSLIIHPASTTHQQLDEEAQKSTGVTKDLIRLFDPKDKVGQKFIRTQRKRFKSHGAKIVENMTFKKSKNGTWNGGCPDEIYPIKWFINFCR